MGGGGREKRYLDQKTRSPGCYWEVSAERRACAPLPEPSSASLLVIKFHHAPAPKAHAILVQIFLHNPHSLCIVKAISPAFPCRLSHPAASSCASQRPQHAEMTASLTALTACTAGKLQTGEHPLHLRMCSAFTAYAIR